MTMHPCRSRLTAPTPLAPNVFFSTAPQRVGLARQRFFDEGLRPTGLVPDAVIQSWTRCVQARRNDHESVSFTPVSRSRIGHTLARNRQLLEAGRDELLQLQAMLAGTACKAILTDADCVVVHATHTEREDGQLMWLAGRVGVDLAEDCVGTTAPGVVAITGRDCAVHGAEHYFRVNHTLQCAAAPIRGAHGELVAVLDLSCESRAFEFDAPSLVNLFATAIENRLLSRQTKPHVLLRFQAGAHLLHTPLEGLAAVGEQGQVEWMNAAAKRLLHAPGCSDIGQTVEQAFGLKVSKLTDAARAGVLLMHRLPNGLTLCVQAQLQTGDQRVLSMSMASPAPVALPAVPEPPVEIAAPAANDRAKLRDASLQLIETALADCAGNVSRAARVLGVSRGLIYRRLKQQSTPQR
jgi:transcriptional regulator of acetoin/glycerol metabolism